MTENSDCFKIAVLSGKGGVGKSTVAVNLAYYLASKGHKTALLDVDIHGPSIPKMLNIENRIIDSINNKMLPVEVEGLEVMSIGFLLDDPTAPVIWRGPLKATLIRQFLEDVAWNSPEYLVIDCPPGTGDEPLSVFQPPRKIDGAIVVTTPQDVAILDVAKSVNFCKQLNTPIIGIVENMSGFICPKCGERVEIFKTGGGKKLAEESQVPFSGSIPLDPVAVTAGDEGAPYIKTASSQAFKEVFENIYTHIKTKEPSIV